MPARLVLRKPLFVATSIDTLMRLADGRFRVVLSVLACPCPHSTETLVGCPLRFAKHAIARCSAWFREAFTSGMSLGA